MILRILETGPLMVNCYIVGDEASGEAAIFDPGGDVDRILTALSRDKLNVKFIANTHTHWDHVGGNRRLHEVTGAPIVTHRDEAPALEHASAAASMMGGRVDDSRATQFIEEGETLTVGSIRFEILDVRGHSPASLAFVFEGDLDVDGKPERRKAVICGDALFAGSIGRTDFPGGDYELLLENIRKKIFVLPDDTLVLSGHGPVSTVGREKRYNPFFQ
jgi:hydroxyacylglutathione hydrolase